MRTITLASMFVCFASPVLAFNANPGPVLWNNVRAGMTEAQLRAVYPNLREKQGQLVGPSARIGATDYAVSFATKKGVLSTVTLVDETGSPEDAAANLSRVYGTPATPYHCGDYGYCSATWTTQNGVSVALSYVGDFVLINYNAPASETL